MSGLLINPYAFASGGANYTKTGITAQPVIGGETSSFQVGWEFTVGASDITVGKLRIYFDRDNPEETLRLWRVSDQALLASVDITPAANEWVEASLSSAVVLSASASYVVATRSKTAASRTYLRRTDVTGLTFASEITHVRSRLLDSDGFPTSTQAGIRGLTDIVFSS